jgi:hypothetical protein
MPIKSEIQYNNEVDDEVRKRLKLFSGVRVTRSLVSRVIFVNRCFLLFLSLDDCVVCPSIYGF